MLEVAARLDCPLFGVSWNVCRNRDAALFPFITGRVSTVDFLVNEDTRNHVKGSAYTAHPSVITSVLGPESTMSTSPKRPCLRNATPVPTPYLNNEPLVDALGILYLLTHGYINLPSTGIPVPESGFGYGKHKTPAVAYRQFKKTGIKAAAGKVVLPVEEEYYIHPIFSRDRWEIQELASRSMPHWDALKPVWQLATLMLEENSMSGFLCGMLDRSKHVELKDKHNGQKLYMFEAKKNPTQEELWELWESLWNLKDVITFGALENSDDLDRMTFGETVIQLKKPGLMPS
jgi:hypothetical protein